MGLIKKINKSDVWLIEMDPTKGSKIKKTRPCVVVSPNSVNTYLNTITIVPLTTTIHAYPTRVNCIFNGKNGQAAIDQIRSLDKIRLKKKLGTMDSEICKRICDTIVEAFKWE